MIKAAIFDMDGVLLDSMGIWDNLGKRFLESQGVTAKDNLNAVLWSMTLEEGAEYMKKEYNLSVSADEIVNGINKIIENFYFYEVEAKPGMAELIRELKAKNIPVAAATSSDKEHITKALERLGVLDCFKVILTSADVGKSKRSPDIYNTAAEILGAVPSETFVFEDAAFCLETAGNAGFVTIGVNDAEGGENQEAVRELSDIYIENTVQTLSIITKELI